MGNNNERNSMIMEKIYRSPFTVIVLLLATMVGFLATFPYLPIFAYSSQLDLMNPNEISWYDKALAMNQNNVPALVEKGTDLVNSGRSQQAIQFLDKALEIDPTNIMALASKGTALRNTGQYHEAIVVYDRILKIDSNDVYAMGGKADSLYGLGHTQQGLSWIQNALEKDPNNPTIMQVKYMLEQASD